MPRTVPAGLLAKLQQKAVTLAQLVLIVRADGVRLAFTSSDEPVVYGGDTYEPTPSLSVSSIETSVGSGVDNQEAGGALTSDLITEEDIATGRYDRASITTYLCDPTDVAAGVCLISTGFIGEITVEDGAFKAEVRSLSQILKGVTGTASSPSCRCRRLGDAQCKFDLTGTAKDSGSVDRTAMPTRTVTAVVDGLVTFGSEPSASGFFDNGLCRFTAGANDEQLFEIKKHLKVSSDAQITFRLDPPHAVEVGDTAVLTAGCDRTLPTCRSKFNNANNYHGEWDLPGNLVMAKTGRGPS